MAQDSPFTDLDASRDYPRVALALVALLAVILAASALPVLAPGGTESPAASVVPIPGDTAGGGGGSGTGGSGGGSLGALSPGQRTDVGGDLGGEDALSSQSTERHFVVTSTRPDYWRTGSYARYTGSGWAQTGETEAYDGRIDTRGVDGREVRYEVELDRSAVALPTVWRPESVSRDDVVVTDGRAVQAERPLPAGTTFSGVSQQPPADAELLRTAGTDYPSTIERRYTQVPASTRAELGPTTDEITASASNPYEEARAVETWLESNKEYSLNVSEPPEDDVATQFVHEMDAGYCEYFATSMVAMLRTQDVPARYVVGYSTGQPTGENTYTVRGLNAHAWVEVYFPDVGWVKFDPTPADDRRQEERESLEADGLDESPATPTPTDEGTRTPAETATPTPVGGTNGSGNGTGPADETHTATPTGGAGEGETETGPGGGEGETEGQQGGDTGYDVELNRSAAPGATVEVTVTSGGAPVSDATVLFNGESVGETGPNGTVVGEVPYADELNVSVVGPGSAALAAPPAPPADGDRLFLVEGPTANVSTTYPLSTNASVTVSGDAVTGNTVVVAAVVDDVPVRGANVSVDGERVARTDRRGRAEVTLPRDPGQVTVAVDRGSVSGSRTLDLEELNVTTTPTAPLALPFTGVEVRATLGDDPAPNATVSVDGQRAATTGVDGTATVRFPFESSATVAVTKHGQSGTVTHDGLVRNLAVAVAGVVLVLAAVAAVARRYGVDPRRAPRWTWLAGQWLVAAVVGLGSAVDAALTRLAARARLTVAHLRALVEGRRSLAELLDALRAWFGERVEEAQTPVKSGVSSAVAATRAGDDGSDAHDTLRAAWTRFLDAVSVRRPHTHTPGEIGTHAVAVDDLPEAEVATVVDAFRAVEYGQRDPGERAPDVEAAVEAIEAHLETERADSQGTGDGSTGDGPVRGADAGVGD